MSVLNEHSARAHALLSASGAERWLACPASAKLAEQYPAQDTDFTREGTLAHEVAEFIANGGNAEDVRETMVSDEFDLEEMIRHAENYRDFIDGLCGTGTTKMLEVRVDFSNWVPEGFGTADCILLHPDGVMDVIDFKYGKGVEVSAVNNPQMMLYGLGAYNDYGFVYDIQRVRLHIFQPRKDNISDFDIPVELLLEFGKRAHEKAEETLSDSPAMHEGKHCKFCPHAGRCTRLTRACIGLVSYRGTLCPRPTNLTPEAVSKLLELEPMITAWLKKLKEQARTDLLNGEEIPGFKVVEGKLGNRKWTDELAVAKALDEAGIAKEDYTTVELLSPAAMDKALGKKRAAELLSKLTVREPGAPVVVPNSDKRPKLDRLAQAQDDFKEEK